VSEAGNAREQFQEEQISYVAFGRVIMGGNRIFQLMDRSLPEKSRTFR
jgi:hypothetical protein